MPTDLANILYNRVLCITIRIKMETFKNIWTYEFLFNYNTTALEMLDAFSETVSIFVWVAIYRGVMLRTAPSNCHVAGTAATSKHTSECQLT